MLHELIDRDEPKCLYCNSNFDSCNLESVWIPHSPLKEDKEILTCLKCEEVFEIISIQGSDGRTEYTGFTFTCKDFRVFDNYIECYFDINDRDWNYIITIPTFAVDFSDKNKLYEKLKTYLLFS